ncbi:MAG: ABC transporter permease [Chitinophagaceae bacterium]|nr:ABC transporter permease [Chitinophagaceae bacterium]
MLRNYFKTAWRNILRNKTFSIINIGGLALGLAACWLIMLYVNNEFQYDRYHANADRIYRIAQHAEWGGGNFHLAITSAPFAEAFKKTFPEVQDAVRLDAEGGGTITYADKHIKEEHIFFADSSFFRMFSYTFLYGNKNALDKPQSIIITKTLAQKIFGDPSAALNQIISFGKNEDNLVTAVIDDVPANSHFTFSAIRRMPETDNSQWGNSYLYTYILLHKGADIQKLNAKLPSFYNTYLKASMESVAGKVDYHMELQPLTSIHLNSNLGFEIAPNGSLRYVVVFSLVAVLILLIASINYMNLSTARSSLRVKEIGVRKVNGSSRWQLAAMFLSESVFITFIASLIAILLVKLLLPWFLYFIGKDAGIAQPGPWQTTGLFLAFALITGCLSGIYPAFFLSGFKLIPSLKGQTGNHNGNLRFRQSLVVFQFVITIAMLAGSFIIYQQLQYIGNKNLGFNKNQVLSFHVSNREARTKVPLIKAALLESPLIEMVSAAGNPIGNNNLGGRDYRAEEANGKIGDKDRMATVLLADEDFINTMQIKMLAGRNFSKDMSTDKDRVLLINEALAKREGWKEPLGKKIQMGVDSAGNPNVYIVAGVMNDFNVYSLQHTIEPLIVQLPLRDADKDNIYVRVSSKDMHAAVQHVENVFRKFDAVNPFEYSFLDENFARQYGAEKMQGKLLMTFTILAIIVACLGLFGLITFTVEQRRKEIGIRKVLGSSVSGIVLLLAKDLVKLVMIAIVIATPIAWIMMNKWLQDFAYRINIGWWIFAVAGLTGLLIAFVTVSVKAVKAATANPVKALRTE